MKIADDVAGFLGRHTRAFLLTRRADGGPAIHPMTAFFSDGRMTMTTYRKSAKARNVERDPRAGCLVIDGYGKDEVRAVLLRGRGRLRPAEPVALPTTARDAPKVPEGIAGRIAERMASGKRIFLDIEPDEADFVTPRRGG